MNRPGADPQTTTPTLAEILPAAADDPLLAPLADEHVPAPLKAPVDPADLAHRHFDRTAFWQAIPAFADVDEATFLDPVFQNKHSVTSPEALQEMLGVLAPREFLDDVAAGFAQAPMNVRLSPYILSRMDWTRPYDDPVRRQFLPVASTRLPDHPGLTLDSLHERDDSPTSGLVHRYPDKVLFLALDVCPVYCRFCTRSYAIGGSTETVDKDGYKPQPARWRQAMAYIASRPEVEDVVLSGCS